MRIAESFQNAFHKVYGELVEKFCCRNAMVNHEAHTTPVHPTAAMAI